MKRLRIYALAGLALVAFGCQKENIPEPGKQEEKKEWIERSEDFQKTYTLDQMVVLSRHNIRSPLVSKTSVLTRLTNNDYSWYPWTGTPSHLTAKGERLESKMGAFFREWLGRNGFIDRYTADKSSFRIYANAKQRCQVTARKFTDALLPGENAEVEMKVAFDTMDPVFTPQTTKITEGFVSTATSQINTLFGDLNEAMKDEFALMERVIDITNAPAYPDTTSFGSIPSSVSFSMNAEPSMKGGLKMACTVSDALSLQYYEEPDQKKAAFGHEISFDDWVSISSVKEWYGDVLFTAPAVAVNVAHPLLEEILSEMQSGRSFTFLCGHDSNIGSVLAALDTDLPDLPGSIEKRTPIGGKLIFETFTGADGKKYADLLLVYASAAQLRAESILSYGNPPMCVKIGVNGLTRNSDGLYLLSDIAGRLEEAISAYDKL